MGRLLSLASRAGVLIGLVLSYGPLYFNAQEARNLGLPWSWWLAIGVTIFFASAAYIICDLARENARLKAELADLELGEPIREPNERLARTHMVPEPSASSTASPPEQRVPDEQVPITLYRISIRNKGADAPGVSVKFIGADPPIPRGLAPAILHLAGDNPDDHVSFARSFPLHKDDWENIDVISFSKSTPPRYFLHKIASADAAEEAQLAADSYIFTIGAFAGNASKLQDYRVHKDASGSLTMTRL